MIKLGIFLLALTAVGIICGIVSIFYNPDEYEYTDYRQDYRKDCRMDYRQDEPEGERHD